VTSDINICIIKQAFSLGSKLMICNRKVGLSLCRLSDRVINEQTSDLTCYVQTSKVFFCKLEGMRRRGYGRMYSETCFADTRSEARATNRRYFYGSGIWVNVPKRRYNALFQEQCNRRSWFRVKELNLFNSWTTCDLWGQREKAKSLDLIIQSGNDFC